MHRKWHLPVRVEASRAPANPKAEKARASTNLLPPHMPNKITFSKVLERLLARRLTEHLVRYLSTSQFGFLPGLTTTDAVKEVNECSKFRAKGEIVVLITIDARNAFNAARWDKIIQALRRLKTPEYLIRMVKSYSKSRQLLVGGCRIELSCRVPQGSILGPILWNAPTTPWCR